MRRERGIFLSLFLSAALPLAGQEADTLTASRVFAAEPRPVVQATESYSLEGRVDAPAQLADVLKKFTGVQVKDYGGVGGLKTVNIRSLGSEHVGVFLDGLPIDNAQNMQVDLSRFSTEGLESVSLYSGQKSRRLQSAREYASGAAVYLASARPLTSGGAVRLRGGSFATLNPSLRWEHVRGRWALRTLAEFSTSNGRYRFPYFDTTLVRENSDIRSLRLQAQLYRSLRSGTLQLQLYGYGSERGFPGPVIRRASGFPFSAERQADQDLFVQGSWQQEWSPRYATALRGKYSNHYTHYNTHPERNPMALPYDLHYRQQAGYLSLAQSLLLGEPWSLDMSTDLQYNSLDADVGQFVGPRRLSFTGALASRVAWERFRAAAHLVWQGTWDHYAQQAGGWTRENSFRGAWMPSLSLYYAPWPFLEIDAFVKRSYRLPSFNDLYYSLMGNASLVPEEALQTGLDLRLKGSRGPWSWGARLSPYYNQVDHKIVAIPTVSQFRWTMLNIGRADILGLDMKGEGGYRKGDWTLELTLRYSFQQALDHSTPGSLTYGNQLPYIPRHSGSVLLQAGWRKWKLCWDSSFTGERWSRSANTADYYLPPWSLSDLSLSRELLKGLTAGLRVENILNHRYEVVQGYPMPGAHVLATLLYQW